MSFFNIFTYNNYLSGIGSMANFEQFIDKLGPYPNDVNRLARLIRFLDKRVENLQSGLNVQQKKFQAKLKEIKDKKITQIPPQMKAQYENIVQKQKEMYGYAKQKQAVSDQLLGVINNSYEMIKNDLKNKIKENKPSDEQIMAGTKKPKKKPIENIVKTVPKQQQFMYDNVNPKYCYCVGGGYGQMVECENNYCEKQWFHTDCIEDNKNFLNQQDWHCKDCKKLIEKYKKSPYIKEFL